MTSPAPADALAVPHGELRALFPSFGQQVDGRDAVFLDGPGGTQVPRSVMEAMTSYLSRDNANTGGSFITSQRTDEAVAAARVEMARFLNASRPEEIVFGQNSTSLWFALSRALARTWKADDEIIVTSLDHDANITPWTLAARDAGATVRTWEFRTENCTLNLDDLDVLLTPRTRLVAFTHASNAVGTIPDVAGAIRRVRAKSPRATVFIDAVHYTPHNPVDVRALDCDFLGCSAYKFCGPHLGILYGKYEHLDRLEAYKVRPSYAKPPGKWETGTQSFESISGLRAALAYLASVGGMQCIREYEFGLVRELPRTGAPRARPEIYGLTDPTRANERTPTFGVTLDGWNAAAVAAQLGAQGIFVWDGHFYAVDVIDRLGLKESGGLVRIGFAHYNTLDEVARTVDTLKELAQEWAGVKPFDYSLDYRTLDLRAHPELYRVGKGEQGVLLVQPYKGEILPHWKFATPDAARKSSVAIFGLYEDYKAKSDFVGMDMARKFLQMGYTRARRYANHKGGKKYAGPVPTNKKGQSGAHGREELPRTDPTRS